MGKILKCPFCGGEVKVVKWAYYDFFEGHCSECVFRSQRYNTESELVAAITKINAAVEAQKEAAMTNEENRKTIGLRTYLPGLIRNHPHMSYAGLWEIDGRKLNDFEAHKFVDMALRNGYVYDIDVPDEKVREWLGWDNGGAS